MLNNKIQIMNMMMIYFLKWSVMKKIQKMKVLKQEEPKEEKNYKYLEIISKILN